MNSSRTSGLDLAVTHLNAPVGQIVTTEDLRQALRTGSLEAIRRSEAASLVSYLFVELDPALIMR